MLIIVSKLMYKELNYSGLIENYKTAYFLQRYQYNLYVKLVQYLT
jgi:hypothetical protein